MVRAILIHTLRPGPCKVLYSRCYGQERPENELVKTAPASDDVSPQELSDLRELRGEQLQYAAERVQQIYQFRTSVSGKSFESDLARLNNEGIFPELELGFAKLPRGVFNSPKVLVFLGAINCGFTLICEADDNRVTAEIVLKLLVRYLQQHCRVFTQPSEIRDKSDCVTAIVEQFLPGGHLIVMNHRLVRQLEKDLDVKMKNM